MDGSIILYFLFWTETVYITCPNRNLDAHMLFVVVSMHVRRYYKISGKLVGQSKGTPYLCRMELTNNIHRGG